MSTGPRDASLRFATFLAPNMLPVYRFLAERIAQRLGRPVQAVLGSSFDQFEHGQADLGVLRAAVCLAGRPPPPAGRATSRPGAGRGALWRPPGLLLQRDRPPRQPHHPHPAATGPLVGPQRARSPFRSNRHPLYELVHIDARPGFFSSVVEAGFHQRAIRLVAHGQVDAAAIDSQVLAVEPATVPAGRRPAGDRQLRPLHHPTGGHRQPPARPAQDRRPGPVAGARRAAGGALRTDAGLHPGLRRNQQWGLRRHPGHARRHLHHPSARKANPRMPKSRRSTDPRRGSLGLSITLTPQPCWWASRGHGAKPTP